MNFQSKNISISRVKKIFLGAILIFVLTFQADLRAESQPKNLEKISNLDVSAKAENYTSLPVNKSETAVYMKNLQLMEERLAKRIDGLRASSWEKTMPALIGLVGVFIGTGLSGWFAYRTQLRQLERQRHESAREVRANVMEFRSRQLNEFYAPIQFMLHGTNEVRKQLLQTLAKHSKPEENFLIQNDVLMVNDGSARVEFHLTRHMYIIAPKYSLAMPLVKEIIDLGEKISNLILEKGGLVNPESKELVQALSKYLGHYSILKDVYEKAIKRPRQLSTIAYSNPFPEGLEELLRNDEEKLYEDIQKWECEANKILGLSLESSN